MKKYTQSIQKHIWYYITFILIEIIETIFVSIFAYDHQIVMTIIIAVTGILTSYGCLHAYVEHKLTSKIVIEYVLMGAVGIAIAFFVFH